MSSGHYSVNGTEADELVADRGPRYAVRIGLRQDGRFHVRYAETSEQAERIYDRYMGEGGYLISVSKVFPPAEKGDVAALGRARKAALAAAEEATSILRAAVLHAVQIDGRAEAEVARDADVDRMTVRSWLGK